jgi:hypothetical protein
MCPSALVEAAEAGMASKYPCQSCLKWGPHVDSNRVFWNTNTHTACTLALTILVLNARPCIYGLIMYSMTLLAAGQ